jgi:hypothetical protein
MMSFKATPEAPADKPFDAFKPYIKKGDPYLPPVTMPNVTISRSQSGGDPYLPPVTMPNVSVSRTQADGDPYLPPVTMPNVSVSRVQTTPP